MVSEDCEKAGHGLFINIYFKNSFILMRKKVY